MTLDTFATFPLTINDNCGSEASSLPARGPRLRVSHAVGLVREPCRTHTPGHSAYQQTTLSHPAVGPPRGGQSSTLYPPIEASCVALRNERSAKRSPLARDSSYSFGPSLGCVAPRPGDTKQRAAGTAASAAPAARALRTPQVSSSPPGRQRTDRQSDIFARTHGRQSRCNDLSQSSKTNTRKKYTHNVTYTQRFGYAGAREYTHDASQAHPPSYAWHLTHAAWNRLRRIEHGNTSAASARATAADKAVCPRGHCCAAQGGGQGAGPVRRMFTCLVCGKRFSQITPARLEPGQDPESRWVSEGAVPDQHHDTGGEYAWLRRHTVQATPVSGPSHPPVQLPSGILRVQAPPAIAAAPPPPPSNTARRGGPCVGDTKLIFHNRQGESVPSMAFEALEQRLLPRAAVVALVETGWDEKTISTVERRMHSRHHRVYCAPALSRSPRCSVAAVVVRADVERVEGEGLLWQREDGKAVIAAVALSGEYYYIMAAHYPAAGDDDEARADFETDMRSSFETKRAVHEALYPEWKGASLLRGADRNMVDRWGTGQDEEKQHSYSARAARAIGITRAGLGLADVWMTLRPNEQGYTHGQPGSRRRLDGWECLTGKLGRDVGVVDVQIVDALALSIPWVDRKKGLKVSDHDAVEITLRRSTEPRPQGEARIRAGALSIPGVRKFVTESASRLGGQPGDAQQRFDRWAAGAVARCHRAYQEARKARAVERTRLERHVRRQHSAHAIARQNAAQLRRQEAARPFPSQRLTQALAKAHEHRLKLHRAEGKLARHDRRIQRARRAVEERESAEVEAARGKQRKPPHGGAPPLTYMCTKDAAGNIAQEFQGQEQVAAHQREAWRKVLNIEGWNEQDVREEMDAELEHVRRDGKCQVPSRLLQNFETDALFHVNNIRKAINRLNRGSSPGIDKVSAELMLLMVDDEEFIAHLREVFLEWHAAGRMGDASRTAMLTTLFKNKPGAERSNWAMYRPVSVTTILYRIYGGCLEQCLSPAMQYILGDPQVGYQKGRKLDENINLVTETIRYINNDAPHAGGLLLMLDNEKAFDRVQWPFMLKCLRAFGLPEAFVAGVRTMYTDIHTAVKTNGRLGAPFGVTSGIRQGCVLSALLYVITQEVQLRMVRRGAVRGVEIPGPDGRTDEGHTVTIKERALVDDTLVLLRDAQDLTELVRVIERFQRISNHKMNFSKSVLILLGKYNGMDLAHSGTPEARQLRDAMASCGLSADKVHTLNGDTAIPVPKWHGVALATEAGIAAQCTEIVERAVAAASDLTEGQTATKDGARGREAAARWGVAGHAIYPLRYQVPHNTTILHNALEKIQVSMGKVATGGYHGTQRSARLQPRAEGGWGHMHIRRHLEAGWHKQGLEVICSADARPWKNYYAYYVRRHMPALGIGRAALASNLRFGPIRKLKAGQITGVAKQVFEALGSAPSIRPCARYGYNKVHPKDRTRGVTGIRDVGRILYRATPRGQSTGAEQSVGGLRPKEWRAPTSEAPPVALGQMVTGLPVVGHVWTSLSWEAALYREWVKPPSAEAVTTPVADNSGEQAAGPRDVTGTITLTALWDKAIGDGHEVCALTHTQQAAQRLRVADGHQYVKKAVDSGAVIIRHGGRGNTRPAVDAQGVLSTIRILPSELPPVLPGRSPSLFIFKQKISRALQDRLAAWEAEVRTAISDQLTGRLEAIAEENDTQLDPHSTHPRNTPWSWEEILRQSLPGNVHLEHASDWSGRLTQAAEARALRWATLGVTHVSNLLIKTERSGPWRLMTPEEAEDCHGLPQVEYREFIETALPRDWKLTLEMAPERYCASVDTPQWPAPAEGHHLRTRSGAVLKVTRTPTPVSTGRAQQLEWQGCTARLAPVGPEINVSARALQGMPHVQVRRRPLPVTEEDRLDELDADPLSPDAIRQREAEHLQIEAITPVSAPGGEDAEQLGYVRPSTVRMARLMALGSCTSSGLASLAAAAEWKPLRTMDATEARAHYYQWLKHMRPNTQRLVVARWIRTTQAEWLPGQARDIYLRRLHSADFMGPSRCSAGWEFCARCRKHVGGLAHCMPAQHENAIHAHEACPAAGGAAEIMSIVVRCWEEMTGEVLRPSGPTALFGDRRHGRQEEDAQQYAHLEEPWRALHAAVVIALDVARRNSRPPEYTKRKLHQAPLDEEQQPLPWSTARIMSRACKELNKIARRRADQLLQKRTTCNRSAYPEFQKAWISTGLATIRRGQVCTRILANWRNPHQPDAQQRLLR